MLAFGAEEVVEARTLTTKPAEPAEPAEFALPLLRDPDLPEAHLKSIFADLLAADPHLDVKLARLLPGRYADPYELGANEILRLLAVLDAISPGPRLLMTVAHLAHHTDLRVASEAVLWIGRRRFNREWVKRHLHSQDGAVRANLIESLWRYRAPFTVILMRRCLMDEDPRVVGNALLGLHLNGEAGISRFSQRMLRDRRPRFRRTAAWLMGQIGDEENLPALEQAAQDEDAGVREEVAATLAKLRQPTAPAPAGAVEARPEPPRLQATPRWLPDFELKLDGHYLGGLKPAQ